MTATASYSFGIVKYDCHLGQEKKGVEETPNILLNELLPHLEQNHIPVHVYNSNEIKELDSEPTNDEFAIFQANLVLRQLTLQSLKINRRTLNIGGDHTMALGTVSGFLECFSDKDKMVIWIDAHADVNTRDASDSGHYHGMPLAFLLGLDRDEKFPIQVLLKPEQLIYVGIRDVDAFEKHEVISKYNIRCISKTQLSKNDLDELVVRSIGENKYVHISWDVDSTNPQTEIPSTGTTAEGGLTCEQVKRFIRATAKHNQLVSMDVTELNLNLGSKEDQQKSLEHTVDVLNTYIDC